MSSVMKFITGSPELKQTANQKQIETEVRETILRIHGAKLVAAVAMDALKSGDELRVSLAQDDPTLNLLLARPEAVLAAQVERLQRNLYNPLQLP